MIKLHCHMQKFQSPTHIGLPYYSLGEYLGTLLTYQPRLCSVAASYVIAKVTGHIFIVKVG